MRELELRKSISREVSEYWDTVEYMENLDLRTILKIILKKDLKYLLRIEAFKYLAEHYEAAKEEGDIWTNDIQVDGKTYSFNIYEDEEGFINVTAYPVIPDGPKYTKEDTSKGIEILRIKEINVNS